MHWKNGIRLFVLLLALLALALSAAAQTERIRSFDSVVTLHEDGSLNVQETIKVVADGEQIRHGIYRDFPTQYRDLLGNRYDVGFEIVSVERDGSTEPYHTSSLSNGVRIYMGDPNSLVSRGLHTYVLAYRTTRQLGFFADHDELYWNVTGNGWLFPIDSVTSTVVLPSQVRAVITATDAYTGNAGERDKQFTASRDGDGNPQFEARDLLPYQGLTIVISWPKGLIAPPTTQQKLGWFAHDNRGVIVGLAGLGVVLLYYLMVWSAVGRDPEPGPIMPLYEPPDGMSPAAIRYLERMRFDEKAFSAAVLDLAARGYLTIECNHANTYTLKRKSDYAAVEKSLPADEKSIARALFAQGDSLALEQANHAVISGAEKALQLALHTSMEKIYFVTNARYLWPGVLLTVLGIVAVALLGGGLNNSVVALFMTVWLSGWTVGVSALLAAVIKAWKAVLGGSFTGVPAAVVLTLFSLPFLAGEGFGILMLYVSASAGVFVALISMIGVNVLFHRLLKAPTRAGRQLLDRIDGFKLFLGAVEGDRLNRVAAPPAPVAKTPQLFERFLSYALALGVEHAWAEQFSREMAAAAGAGTQQSPAYAPSWYSGPGVAGFSAAAFTSAFSSSFSSAISSSSTAPGSSSGSGGGGSSGGGGGGGGGGGW